MNTDISAKFMERSLYLARLGAGQVSPNPLVGAVIVADGKIIGEGWHRQFGSAHAEVNAIADVKPENRHLLQQSTLYVNLEPCAHTGKTPPCADLILRHRIPGVVIAQKDPNPLVAGKGINKLVSNGVSVTEGVLLEASLLLNRSFNHHIVQKKPYVVLKWAESADGFIGKPEQQVWLSNNLSKRISHQWRNECDAILVGYQTAVTDNPTLTNRLFYGKSPLRIVFDRHLRLKSDLQIFNTDAETIIITEKMRPPGHAAHLHYICLPFDEELIENLLHILYHTYQVGKLLVEGGAFTLNTFLLHQQFQEIRIIRTKKKLGTGIKAPLISGTPDREIFLDDNSIACFLY